VKRVLAVLLAALVASGQAVSAEESRNQITVSSFTGAIPSGVKGQIRLLVSSNSLGSSISCTAVWLSNSSSTFRSSALARGKSVCDYAKGLNPNLQVFVLSKVSSNKSFAGKVIMTIKTPASTLDSSALVSSVPAAKTLSALSAHLKAIDQAAKKLKPIQLSFVAGPTTVASKVSLVTGKFQDKLKMYQLLGLTSLSMDWVIASEKDYEWWRDYRSKQDKNYPLSVWDSERRILGHCRLSNDIFCGAGNGVNGKNYQDNVVGTNFSGRGLDYVTRHEAAHFYQAVFGYGGRCWFAEGQATFFETYLESSSRTRSQVIQRLKESPAKVSGLSLSSLEQKLASDSICQGDSNIAYDLGMLVFEYLYMNYSLKQVHDLMVKASGDGWNGAVRAVLAEDPAALNKQLAEYIKSNMN
jgi:hypothetical protein